jgi:imidazolonepropionase-like amidohydrolase
MTISRLGKLAIASAAALASAAHAQSAWTLKGATIYPSPDVAPIHGGRVVVSGNRIQAVTGSSDARAPAPTKSPECSGGVVVAGFQNSHVHLTGDEYADAGHQPTDALTRSLTNMLTRYGYTTVFDITSDRDSTLALRARIEKGEVRGPRILTVGFALFPPHGLPIYISHMRKSLLDELPQPAAVDAALKVLEQNFAAGTDGTKLFIATPQADGSIKRMSADIMRAATEATHRRGQLVFVHPTDFVGVQAALDAHVDILAHPPLGQPAPWSEALLKQVRDAGISMIPTLKLLPFELQKEQVPPEVAQRIVNENVREFGRFAAMGGQILFGTDVGYMTDFDPTLEYELMAQAGMTPMQILASLTTTPAARWHEQDRRGRLAAGMDADIVVLNADPADSPRNFSNVRCVIRSGEVIYVRHRFASPEAQPPK